jgi:hypothetical protein
MPTPILIDFDRTGKVQNQAWMKFMEAEFDRLDPGKTGAIAPETGDLHGEAHPLQRSCN